MYAGHIATALALKAARPSAPTWALVLGAGLMDVAFGCLVVVGVEGVMPDYPVSHRLDIPWSHSLLSSALLGLAFAGLFHRRGVGVMAMLFAAVTSHWALDVMSHRPDMAVWPGSPVRLGFAAQFGGVSGWFETVIVVTALAVYIWRSRRHPEFGDRPLATGCAIAATWAMGLAA